MDLFNYNFWKNIKKHIEAFHLNFTLNLIGGESLDESEKEIIRNYFGKENLAKSQKEIPLLDKIYIFGKVAQKLKGQHRNLYYKDFINSLDKEKYPENTKVNSEDLKELKKQAYLDILDKQFNIEKSLRQEIIKREQERKATNGKLDLKYIKSIANSITGNFEKWTGDLNPSINYISQSAFNQGRISTILEESKDEDPLVYFIVHPDACHVCKKVYLEGNKPKIFKLSYLRANGTNIGRKANDWKPTIFAIHPNCRCLIEYLPKGYIWNEDKKDFLPKVEETQRIQRPKVNIYIGDKKFEV